MCLTPEEQEADGDPKLVPSEWLSPRRPWKFLMLPLLDAGWLSTSYRYFCCPCHCICLMVPTELGHRGRLPSIQQNSYYLWPLHAASPYLEGWLPGPAFTWGTRLCCCHRETLKTFWIRGLPHYFCRRHPPPVMKLVLPASLMSFYVRGFGVANLCERTLPEMYEGGSLEMIVATSYTIEHITHTHVR